MLLVDFAMLSREPEECVWYFGPKEVEDTSDEEEVEEETDTNPRT